MVLPSGSVRLHTVTEHNIEMAIIYTAILFGNAAATAIREIPYIIRESTTYHVQLLPRAIDINVTCLIVTTSISFY